MEFNQILLVQGPPGTGKTSTITGMVSMLLNGGANSIHICAPSNSAVDEILVRILQRGLPGIATTHQELLSIITRIGASEYTAPDEIAPFSLKEKMETKVRNQMID